MPGTKENCNLKMQPDATSTIRFPYVTIVAREWRASTTSYQVGRSANRRRARVHTCVSFARRAEPIARRATCGDARECGSSCSRARRARSRSPPFASLGSIAVISPQVPCRDTRLFLFARRHFVLRTSESGDRRNQDGAPLKVPTRFVRTHEIVMVMTYEETPLWWWRRPRPPTPVV